MHLSLRAGAVKHSHEWQPMSVLITVGRYLEPSLQISALDTNISNSKRERERQKEWQGDKKKKNPSFTFLRNMKLCF